MVRYVCVIRSLWGDFQMPFALFSVIWFAVSVLAVLVLV
jgi:hypothetical protein